MDERTSEKPNITDDEKLFDFLTTSLTEIVRAYEDQTTIMLGIIAGQKKRLFELFPDDHQYDHHFCQNDKKH